MSLRAWVKRHGIWYCQCCRERWGFSVCRGMCAECFTGGCIWPGGHAHDPLWWDFIIAGWAREAQKDG